MNWEEGKVLFFDNNIGRGYVESTGGQILEFTFSAIKSPKVSNSWKSINENAHVKFRPYKDPDYMIIEELKEIKTVKGKKVG